MDGSIRINHSDIVPSVSQSARVSNDGERKRFDPDALVADEEAGSGEAPHSNHEQVPVGHKPDDESGSHLGLTA